MLVREHRELLRALLARGIRWLYRSKQQEDAMMDSHGIFLRHVESLIPRIFQSVCITPTGIGDMPVVIVNLQYPHRFTAEEEGEVRKVVEAACRPYTRIVESWNGAECVSVSYRLQRRASPQVRRMVYNYRRGCTKHGRASFCGCGWYAQGQAKMKNPTGWL